MSVAVSGTPFRVAVITGWVCALTPCVVIVTVAVFPPAGTVTEAGTDASDRSDDRVTTVPPVPAGPLRVTVAVEELPPRTAVGLRVSAASVAGLTVKIAV